MTSNMEIRSFGAADIPATLELSGAAGWNQLAGDWKRIIDVEPDGCLGAWMDGRLVGSTTFVTYDDRLAWIGMVLVRPENRRQGIGRRLFRAIMTDLEGRGIADIGLDATDAGRPLYASEGFVDVGPIVRWQGVLKPSIPAGEGVVVREADDDDLLDLVALDREVTGIDRRPLLEHLDAEEPVLCLVSEDVDGYAFIRPGRLAWQIGPFVARRRESAGALIHAAADVLDGREVVVDSPWEDSASLLEAAGLAPRRRLTRMTYPRVCTLLTTPQVIGATSFAWG